MFLLEIYLLYHQMNSLAPKSTTNSIWTAFVQKHTNMAK